MESPKNVAVNVAQHPLQNPIVLDLVFFHFKSLATFEDWKKVRTVCKTWYFQTLFKWRNTFVLNLKLGPTFNQDQPKNPGVSLLELLKLIENEGDTFLQFTEKPYQKYKLQNLELDLHSVKNDNLFTTLVGPNIKHLILHEVNIKTFTTTVFMEFLVTTMPNLQTFGVSHVYIEGKRIDRPPKRITVVHPNVKAFSLRKCYAFGFENFPNIQEASIRSCSFGDDIVHVVNSNIQRENVDTVYTNSSIVRLNLANCNINSNTFLSTQFTALKHISVDRYIGYSHDLVILSIFLNNHKHTLQSVEIFGSLTKWPEKYCLSEVDLPALTELKAWGNVFADLVCIKKTPNLKVLHLDLYGFEKQEKMKHELKDTASRKFLTKWDLLKNTYINIPPGQILLPNLQYFQINFELPIQSFQTLVIWMPNLKIIKTVLNKDTFPIVCENWPRLEHLECMFGSSIVNQNITGAKLLRRKALVDMEYLSIFKLHTECNKSMLSDDSVAKGFLRVPNLKDLSICVSPYFSKDAEVLLRRGVQKVQLLRNYSSNPLHKNWKCCKDLEYKKFILNP